MASQPFSQNTDGQRTNHLQSQSLPFTIGSAQQLAQFSAATASGYYPKPQTMPSSSSSSSSSKTTDASQKVQATTTPATTTPATIAPATTAPATTTQKPMSAFAASAYETAEHGSSGIQPPPSQPIDLATFKGLKFTTLDGFQLETREVYDKISGTCQWENCESQDDRCTKFVREKCANKRVFLITSGSLGRKVVPSIHSLPQIYAIYIYCADVVANQEWANKYSKVRVVCNNDDEYLLPQFAVDVAQANMEWGDAFFKDGKRDKAKEKYEIALANLTEYARRPDPLMVNKVKGKLNECK